MKTKFIYSGKPMPLRTITHSIQHRDPRKELKKQTIKKYGKPIRKLCDKEEIIRRWGKKK